MGYGSGFLYAGPTYRDIFWQRLRIGTFSSDDMPNHAFFAIMTEYQLTETNGWKWLALLKEAGFEFIRTVDNSVYTGSSVMAEPGGGGRSPHPNYIFGLFRNIGKGAIHDPFTPPKAWTDLPSVVPEAHPYVVEGSDPAQGDCTNLAREQQKAQLDIWNKMPRPPFLTEDELKKAGVPVKLAGTRKEGAAPYVKKDGSAVAPAASKNDPWGYKSLTN